MPMRAMDSREGSSRRLHIGMLSLCMREEAALRKVADAAGIQYNPLHDHEYTHEYEY